MFTDEIANIYYHRPSHDVLTNVMQLSREGIVIGFARKDKPRKINILVSIETNRLRSTRGDQKVRGKYVQFLHRLINRAGIQAHNTATHMQLFRLRHA